MINNKPLTPKFKKILVTGTADFIDFGYKPDTDLKDGIKEFVTWYKKFYGDKNE